MSRSRSPSQGGNNGSAGTNSAGRPEGRGDPSRQPPRRRRAHAAQPEDGRLHLRLHGRRHDSGRRLDLRALPPVFGGVHLRLLRLAHRRSRRRGADRQRRRGALSSRSTSSTGSERGRARTRSSSSISALSRRVPTRGTSTPRSAIRETKRRNRGRGSRAGRGQPGSVLGPHHVRQDRDPQDHVLRSGGLPLADRGRGGFRPARGGAERPGSEPHGPLRPVRRRRGDGGGHRRRASISTESTASGWP